MVKLAAKHDRRHGVDLDRGALALVDDLDGLAVDLERHDAPDVEVGLQAGLGVLGASRSTQSGVPRRRLPSRTLSPTRMGSPPPPRHHTCSGEEISQTHGKTAVRAAFSCCSLRTSSCRR